jgi:tetratricopeptide (TPR) repeat protein
MKIRVAAALFLALSLSAGAQTTKEEFLAKYDLQVSKVGIDGVGVEYILDKWQEAFPDDPQQYIGRFSYNLQKSQSTKVVKLSKKTYLGNQPVVAMKDSLGNPVNFFEETVYDDVLFGEATSAIDKAISICPDRLDFRFYKASALLAYEKESPDMTLAFLIGLVDYNAGGKTWTYPDMDKVDQEFFSNSIQQYCAAFYAIASDSSLEAFRSLAERMNKYYPKDSRFIVDLGTYNYAVKGDSKTAMKYYNSALKLKADDYPAMKNGLLASRKIQDRKMEKKYLQMMVKYAPTDVEKGSAKAMLDALSAKK